MVMQMERTFDRCDRRSTKWILPLGRATHKINGALDGTIAQMIPRDSISHFRLLDRKCILHTIIRRVCDPPRFST